TFLVPNAGATLSLGGVLSGPASAGLFKTGAGNLVLAGANTYAGGTTLGAGTLTLAANTAVGSGLLTLNGGLLDTVAAASVPARANVGGSVTISGQGLTVGNPFPPFGSVNVQATLTLKTPISSTGGIHGAGALVVDIGSKSLAFSNAY